MRADTTLTAIVALVASAALTRKMCTMALSGGVIDIPNARSSHSVPTPRGGGVAIAVVTVAGLSRAAWPDSNRPAVGARRRGSLRRNSRIRGRSPLVTRRCQAYRAFRRRILGTNMHWWYAVRTSRESRSLIWLGGVLGWCGWYCLDSESLQLHGRHRWYRGL